MPSVLTASAHSHRGRTIALRVLAVTAVAAPLVAQAGTGDRVYSTTRHGSATAGVNRVPGVARGACAQCHQQRASPAAGYGLFAANDNGLCFTCHASAGGATYLGQASFNATAHWTSMRMLWPGPVPTARVTGEQGRCVNCHTPHGTRDGLGPVPDLGYVREEALCLACHDSSGPASSNIAAELAKSAGHPVASVTGRHVSTESAPAAYAQRHAECVDCHNPHRATAADRLGGVGRVGVTNGAAGTVPSYTWLPPGDTSAVREYQVCFKCHSSWTTLPAGDADLAMVLNPANESFHPVEAAGRSTSSQLAASLAGGTGLPHLTTSSTIGCGDCHASDAIPTTVSVLSAYDGGVPSGPHGSSAASNANLSSAILRAPYRNQLKPQSGTNDYTTADFRLCFICHSPTPFADTSKNNRSDTVFDLHGFHLGRLYDKGGGAGDINTPGAGRGNAICKECHFNVHGTRAAFFAGNRAYAKGVNFAPNVQGPSGAGEPRWQPGSCNLRCHGTNHNPETY